MQAELDKHKAAAASAAPAPMQPGMDVSKHQQLLQQLQEAEAGAAAVAAERDHAKQQLSRCFKISHDDPHLVS